VGHPPSLRELQGLGYLGNLLPFVSSVSIPFVFLVNYHFETASILIPLPMQTPTVTPVNIGDSFAF
jgi:hypothetical protein